MASTLLNPSPSEFSQILRIHRRLFGDVTMTDTEPEAENAGEETGDDAQDDLGDAGKRALDAERRARKAAEKKAADAQAELDKIAEADKTETEKAAGRATKAEQERDALQSEAANLRRELAVYRLAGTADPVALLDSRSFVDALAELEHDDDKGIKAAIAAATKDRPSLIRTPRTGGDAAAGQRKQARQGGDLKGRALLASAYDAQMGTD